MSGTRFARTGRCRFLVCLGILVLMVGMVAIFHSSQVQLDETREQRLHCEQQQEALNERLTTLVEQKYHLERNLERERNELLETKRNLEQKIKELEEKYQKEEVEQQMSYDKLKQTHTLLQSDHKHLKEETQKANKEQLDNINSLEKKLQSIRSELQKEKSNKSGELIELREKYNIVEVENKRLHTRINELEDIVKDYQSHCEYKARDNSRKPVAPKPDITLGNNNPSTSEKSFKHQDSIVPKPIKRIADDEQQQQEKPNRQLSQENDKNQVAPLSAPKNKGQLASTATSKSEQQVQAASQVNATSANVRTARGSSTSSSNSPPLALPPNQRKLPENVAPIPDNFEDLLQKSNNEALKSNDDPSQLDENGNHDFNENKNGGGALKSANNNNNYDSGGHEMKDALGEGDSNNLQHDDDINNFFDTDQEPKEHNKNNNNKDLNDDKDDDGGNDDDDGGLGLGADNDGGAAAGDIAIKHNQQQQLLDDSLKNEVADDQGKEFGDGLRLDEGAMEEDDDDDYSNPSRKQAGGQAIRN
ncbi:putative mediator of RNA polymerase II transcription subunit 19 isoform X3 [Calliphora vicina]|uniref:putative mediator of RNA polymerase II transcription subunit 19 isoform X3 n=1 Tax=Calliphora vicina TaxID=7373 RepID=UPI00325BFEB5